MRKRTLLLSGMILCAISSYAQPGITEPVRYSDDAKVVCVQDFETATNSWREITISSDPNRPIKFYTWQSQPVDRITHITYYKREGASNPMSGTDIYDGSRDWEIAGIRDTLINIYDGIMRTDAKWPQDSILAYDSFSIEQHTSQTQQGTKGLDLYGESGGLQYFSYSSAEGDGIQNVGSSDYNADNKAVAEYRRNLFINLQPGIIEDNTSYRVTVFLRPTQLAQEDKATPRFGLGLFRGAYHSEKPFIVNDVSTPGFWTKSYYAFDDRANYTELSEGQWNKVTLMAYYNNDNMGDATPYLMGYYWAGNWDWKVGRDADGNVVNDLGRGKARNADGQLVNDPNASDTTTLTFIKQPDKYFVRLSFRSDSTRFDIDNISVTKSWIAGVEHHNDMLRVDFGYETNLAALVQAALEKNKIAAVELPGEYFEVWARYWDEMEEDYFWDLVPINSAEYHGDGYMYMWTKPWEDDGSLRSFEGADSVLVTFRNPVDRDDLKLLYTGSRYPNGGDVEWQNDKNKRVVFDFHNEISTLNPNIDYSNGRKVLSIKDMPPVLQRAPYEEGTFGLDPSLRQMTFKFSRHLVFQNTGNENTNVSFIKVVGNNTVEYWEFNQYADENDTNTVIVRPSKYSTPLSGDYTITIDQITHLEDADLTDPDQYGPDVVLNLHFGDFEVSPANPVVVQTDWRSEITVDGAWDRPTPSSLYVLNGNDGFYQGTGENFDPYTKTGLYKMVDDGVHGDCFFYLCSYKTKDEVNLGRLFSAHALTPGKYKLSLYAFGWGRNNLTSQVFVYPKPATMDEASLETARTSTTNAKIGEIKPTSNISWSGNDTEKTWTGTGTGLGGDGNIKGSDVQFFELEFSIATAGDYVFEWTINNNGSQTYYGISLCNFTVTRLGNLSLSPVRSIIDALDAANAQIAKADAAAKYKGSAYETLKALSTSEASFVATKKASGVNKPTEYKAESELIMNAVNTQKSRVNLIDDFFKTLDDAQAKVNYCDTATVFADYRNIPDLSALQALINSYSTYNYSAKNDVEIITEKNRVLEAIKNVDNRVALGEVYPDAIAYAKAMKNTAIEKGANIAFPETYAKLLTAISEAEAFNVANADYTELRAQMTLLTDAAFDAVNKAALREITPRRIRELDAIAQSLNVTYTDEIAARIATVDFDDDELAAILKCYIKIAIYEKIIRGESIENYNLTPFIKNYYLYATVKDILDNSDLELPPARNEARVATLQGAAQIQKIGHQWGYDALEKKVWVLILNQQYTDVFPGWTVESFVTGNHSMATPDISMSMENLSKGESVFDGSLTLEWNSKAELKNSINGLPVGIYSLGASFAGSGVNGANLTVSSGDNIYSDNLKETGNILDGIVVRGEKIDIDFVFETGSGSSSADNFSLSFTPDDNTNYADELVRAKSELATLLYGEINEFYMDDFTCEEDNYITIPVRMRNTSPIVGFSLDVELPQEISFISAELSDVRGVDHTLSTNVVGNVVSLACLSLTNSALNGYEGAVINLILFVPEGIKGEYDIWLRNMELTVDATSYYNPYDFIAGQLIVTHAPDPGDVNADGRISITDAVGVVAFIINSDVQGLSRRAADANQDGTIDVADAVFIVNKIIHKSYAPMRGAAQTDISSTLSLDNVVVAPSMEIPVRINGRQSEITAMQFKMTLPEGVNIEAIKSDNNHAVMSNKQEDGSYMVVCLSLSNSTFTGGGEAALTMDLTSKESFTGGIVLLENVKIVTPDCRQKSVESVIGILGDGGGQTGVTIMSTDGNSKMFDLQGRAIEHTNGIYIRDGKKLIQIK